MREHWLTFKLTPCEIAAFKAICDGPPKSLSHQTFYQVGIISWANVKLQIWLLFSWPHENSIGIIDFPHKIMIVDQFFHVFNFTWPGIESKNKMIFFGCLPFEWRKLTIKAILSNLLWKIISFDKRFVFNTSRYSIFSNNIDLTNLFFNIFLSSKEGIDSLALLSSDHPRFNDKDTWIIEVLGFDSIYFRLKMTFLSTLLLPFDQIQVIIEETFIKLEQSHRSRPGLLICDLFAFIIFWFNKIKMVRFLAFTQKISWFTFSIHLNLTVLHSIVSVLYIESHILHPRFYQWSLRWCFPESSGYSRTIFNFSSFSDKFLITSRGQLSYPFRKKVRFFLLECFQQALTFLLFYHIIYHIP